MKWSCGKLHVQWGYPWFDIEKAVGKYLLELEPCTSRVLIMSAEYGQQEWLCDVVADAGALCEWTTHMSKVISFSDPKAQAAKQAFPLWLRVADRDSTLISRIPKMFAEVYKDFLDDLIQKEIAWLVCPVCNTVIHDIEKIQHEHHDVCAISSRTDEWRCPDGHLLRFERQDLVCILTSKK